MGAVIPRQRLAVLAEVGDVVQPGAQPVVLLLGDGAAAGLLALAEIQCKGELLLVSDVLAVEHQHGIFVHRSLDLARLLTRQGLAQIEARDLADKMLLQLADCDCHGVVSRYFRAA